MQNPSENRALPRSKESLSLSLSLSLSARPTTTALSFTKLQTVLANCNKYDDGVCAQCRHFWSYLLNKRGGKTDAGGKTRADNLLQQYITQEEEEEEEEEEARPRQMKRLPSTYFLQGVFRTQSRDLLLLQQMGVVQRICNKEQEQ